MISSRKFFNNNVIVEKVVKIQGEAKAERYFNYPYNALEEALVNAEFHKLYREPEPVEIRIYVDYIQIINYPGPYRWIDMDKFAAGKVRARKYRNRPMGESMGESCQGLARRSVLFMKFCFIYISTDQDISHLVWRAAHDRAVRRCLFVLNLLALISGHQVKSTAFRWSDFKTVGIEILSRGCYNQEKEQGFDKTYRSLTAIHPYSNACEMQFGNKTYCMIVPDGTCLYETLQLIRQRKQIP